MIKLDYNNIQYAVDQKRIGIVPREKIKFQCCTFFRVNQSNALKKSLEDNTDITEVEPRGT